ncbi:MAG: helix-turn-helix domain containing protein [Clostridiales bacterium]|jgi:transcriptional regulator with XRE-family HTH domain|nr:helix-turn-helix domain containing protein [Clostridiales bacterium]
MSITERLLDALRRKNISQTQLCEHLGVGTSTVSNWKTCDSDPPAKLVFPICEFIGINITWLLTGEGEMSRNAARPVIDVPTPEETAELRRYFDRLPAFKRGKVVGYAQLLEDDEVCGFRQTSS